jgi:hypothetical protein
MNVAMPLDAALEADILSAVEGKGCRAEIL